MYTHFTEPWVRILSERGLEGSSVILSLLPLPGKISEFQCLCIMEGLLGARPWP